MRVVAGRTVALKADLERHPFPETPRLLRVWEASQGIHRAPPRSKEGLREPQRSPLPVSEQLWSLVNSHLLEVGGPFLVLVGKGA